VNAGDGMLSTIDRLFSNLTGGQRLLAFIFVVAVSASLFAVLVGGWKSGIPIGVLVLLILWLTRSIWQAPESGNTRVRLNSLTVISGVALAIVGRTPTAKTLIGAHVLRPLGLQPTTIEQAPSSDRVISAVVLAFVLIGLFIVNWLTRDKSAMRKHPKPFDEEFPEQTYREQLQRFADILSNRLSTLDDETKWDDYFFAPLEAEVEIISGRHSRKKIVNLMSALKSDRTSRIILVLGDPGAGKSIALRKLAKELLLEVERTGRVPVYLNLKEWGAERSWSEHDPPTGAELRTFILGALRTHSAFADQFLEKYFDRMLDRGRFFFLLDSFDEIPAVLDVNEGSWLIQHLAGMLTEFFVAQENSRGIIASRFYRRPKFGRMESSTFEIRPFSDMQIHEALMRSTKLREDTIERLFRSRTELIPVARNPFSAALIRIYAEHHGGDLPENQLDMYDSYVRKRLEASESELRKHNLNAEAVIAGAVEISWCMFRTAEIGLEVPVPRLTHLLPNIDVPSMTAVLRYSGLARLSAVGDANFSFVHRRLNEYFVALRLLNDPAGVTLQAIPTDSRFRDALVLYCEVGEVAHVTSIALFCWSEIQVSQEDELIEVESPERLRAVHCLRFLGDAFRARPNCVPFGGALAAYIGRRVKPNGNLLAAKIALEAIGLLPEDRVEPILVGALKIGNGWISETALRSCRHLKRVGRDLEESLGDYLRGMTIFTFLRRHREIVFSLSLSDAFRDLRRYAKLHAVDSRLLLVGLVLTFLLAKTNVNGQALFLVGACFAFPVWRARSDLTTLRTIVGCFYILPVALDPTWILRSEATDMILSMIRWAHRPGFILLCGLRIVSAAAIVPFLDLSILSRRLSKTKVGKILRTVLGYAIMMAAMAVIMRLGPIDRFFSAIFSRVGDNFVPVMVAFALLMSSPRIVRTLIDLWRDRHHFGDVTRSTALTRGGIGTDFAGFRTSWFRLRYVEWLRDEHVQPIGTWQGMRPNCKDDSGSTLLAQLDERWLGLGG
jgi:hypothetical protein